MRSDRRVRDLVSGFFDLAAAELDQVVAMIEEVRLEGGHWLFRQGDDGDAFYILARGRLQVWIDAGADAQSGTLVGEVLPGEAVGEISLLTEQKRTAGIRAARDSRLLKLRRRSFERLIEAYPKMAVRLAGTIARRLHSRTSGKTPTQRRALNICLLMLDDSAELTALRDRIVGQMARADKVLAVDPDSLARAGVPPMRTSDGAVPEAMSAWLDEREYDYGFVLYQCQASDSAWTRLALRQADLVVRLADATADPRPRAFEAALAPDARPGERLSKQALVLWHPHGNREITGTRAWLEGRDLDFHLHARSSHPRDIQRIGRVLAGRALGLVLGAGAARGFAHIGVYAALAEAGIDIDWVGGASIGGIFGAGIAKEWSPEELRQRAYEAFVIGKPFSNYTMPMVSLLSGKRMMRLIRQLLPGNIEDLPIPFFCNSSSLDTGVVNVHRQGLIATALQASAAMPGALPPAVVERHLAVDGAVLNGLPVDLMRACPVGEIIAVDLSSHKTYELDYKTLPTAWQLFRSRYLGLGRRYRVPGLITLLLKATEIGSMAKVRAQGGEADLLLKPDVKKFGLTRVKAFNAIVAAGEVCARDQLPNWISQRDRPGVDARPEPSSEVVNGQPVDQQVNDVVNDDHQPG